MKKTLLVLMCLATISGWAQKSQIESAALYFNNAEMEDAKKSIDAAFEHPDTKDNVKMLYFRAAIYDTIATSKNQKVRDLDINAAEKWALAAKRCLELDKKEIYKELMEYNVVNAAFACNSAAYDASQRGEYAKVQSYYQLVIDLLPFDKFDDMKKNNLTEKSIVFNQFYFANKEKNKDDQKKFLKRLIVLDYKDHLIYAYLTNIYLEEGDTATAISYLDKGRTLYPEKKDLIGQEINIYISQNKLETLLQKVELANEQKPDDNDLIYTRGNLYDNAATGFLNEAKKLKKQVEEINKKAKTEKNVTIKKQLETSAKETMVKVNELNKKAGGFTAKAEADYFKALDLNPDMIDAYYNLGAITNNKTAVIAEKINTIEAKTQAEYDKRYAGYKKVQDSIFRVAISQFEKVEELANAKSEKTPEDKAIKYAYLKDAYYSLQAIYAGMGNETKSNEYRKRKEEAIINGKKKS
jgi:hypothetical protein